MLKSVRLSGYLCVLFLMLLSGCSLKKNTAASRNYMAFITRYNIYFNGDEHYKENIKEMEEKYEDDYSRMIYMHPAESHNDEKAAHPSQDFKRSIEKGQKAIQLRSIKKRPARKAGKGKDPEYKKWLKREEYNPFLHNAWLMMARSQYLNGDFLGAASTFFYISKHFWWLPSTVTEAKLWQARCYCAIDWLFEAESILVRIKEKELVNDTLKDLYYFSYADFYLRSKDYEKAVPMLQKAIGYARGAQKIRLTFLLGQVYRQLDRPTDAYEAFRKVGGMSGVNHRTKFNARIKQSEVFQGSDIKPEVKALRALTRFGSNKDFLDQIYYAIGNLYLSRGDTAQAVKEYETSIASSTRNGIDKAMAQLTLGGVYYDMHEYDKAQPCYSEAIPQIPDNYPGYSALKRRSDVLDELAVYSQNVTLQDSLLRLSDMSPEEQRKVVDKIIEDLKKREQEEAEAARREEYMAQQEAAGTGLQQGNTTAPTTFTLNTDKSWYFYNQATKNAGRTEFQKRWGSRKLEDDWRRRNKAAYSFSDEESEDSAEQTDGENADESQDTAEESKEAMERASDPHYPEYYLNQIPSTEAERTVANEVIQEGLYNMGLILKDKMEDFGAAESEWDRLLKRYPDNVYRLDVYYNLYLMYMRSGDMALADKYRELILNDFPDSKYGEALADPDYMEKLKRMPQEESRLYDEAYSAYMANDNASVHRIYLRMRADYPMSRIMPKFMFIEALSYVTENDPDKFSQTLRQLIERYPDTDVSPLASSYLELLAQGRKFNTSGINVRGIVWSTRLSNDSSAVSLDGAPAEFDFETPGPQLLVLIYSTDRVNPNQLLFEVARHNFATFSVRDFDLEQLQFGSLGLLVVSGFGNQAEVNHYRSLLETKGSFKMPKGVVPLIISRHNFDILLNEGRTLDEYFEAVGDDRLGQIHESVLPSEEYPSAKEMYDRSEEPGSNAADRPQESVSDKPQAESVSGETLPESGSGDAAPAPAAEVTETEATGDKEVLPYDVPVPPPPAKNVPVLKPMKKGSSANRVTVYPMGSEGDDPLLD